MTDKQIKDGTDVSQCEFCNDGEYCYIYSGTADFRWMCKENEDCQIKDLLLQLKRAEQRIVELNKTIKAKEQECEELKEEVSLLKEINLKLQPMEDVRSLEKCYLQQLDQLKVENEELKKCYKNNSALLDFEETNTTKLVNKVMKLEKTLTEIKEIIEQGVTIHDDIIVSKQILQKISECEVGDENNK